MPALRKLGWEIKFYNIFVVLPFLSELNVCG